jgi:vancomycin resistance protein YoaR
MLELAVSRSRRRSRTWRRLGLVVLAVAFAASAAAAVLGGRALLHRGEAMPGVTVLGADVAGLDFATLNARVRSLTAARLREPVELTTRGRRVTIAPALLFTLDRSATVEKTLAVGRGSWESQARALLVPLTDGTEIEPVLVERPAARKRLEALLRRFATAPVSASVAMRGSEPVVRPARAGSVPDLARLLPMIERRVLDGGAAGAVTVGFTPARPPIDDDAAKLAADEARLVVSSPVGLTFDGRDLGALSPAQLARLIRFKPGDGRIAVALDAEPLARILDPRVSAWETRAQNARFQVDGTRVHLIASRRGTTLDAAHAAETVAAAARARTGRLASLRLMAIAPDLTTREARALGITERLTTFTTDMGPSSSNRIHNVHLMADYIDGTIVRPGETFSFNESVGPRSPERGFLEGQMIVGSLLLPSVGGGVCQTATTLFNNAWEAGLPITERHNHSFYISHYPLGRDATVSWGGPDFGFTNDMEHAILIKAGYTDSTLTFSFYGTDEGRRVTSATGPKSNWKAPQLTYALDPAAPSGSLRLERGSHQSGFDVTVYRRVEKDGEVMHRDAFKSRYIPVGDTAIYGPGREIPGPYFVIPAT